MMSFDNDIGLRLTATIGQLSMSLDRIEVLEADNAALRERVAELEAQLANYHTHLTQGTLVWKVPPPDYYLQQFDGEGVA